VSEQQTLAAPVTVRGVGLHTGNDCVAVISPADVDTGLRFVLNKRVAFQATSEHVIDTSRATVLGARNESVSTVEHLLSALFSLGIDNAEIAVEGGEIPVLDGSALLFVEAIDEVGIVGQGSPRRRVLVAPVKLHNPRGGAILVEPHEAGLHIEIEVAFRPPIGTQALRFVLDPQAYRREIAPARTFGYLDEVEALRARGLALGGSLENAVVFGPDGPLVPLRFPDEPVRHKVLDLLGDFALLGFRLDAFVRAERSGHALHAQAVKTLREGAWVSL